MNLEQWLKLRREGRIASFPLGGVKAMISSCDNDPIIDDDFGCGDSSAAKFLGNGHGEGVGSWDGDGDGDGDCADNDGNFDPCWTGEIHENQCCCGNGHGKNVPLFIFIEFDPDSAIEDREGDGESQGRSVIQPFQNG